MNTTLLIPRRKRHRPGWLTRIWKRLADYAYYRRLKQGVRESWDKASRTI